MSTRRMGCLQVHKRAQPQGGMQCAPSGAGSPRTGAWHGGLGGGGLECVAAEQAPVMHS